MSGEQKGQLPGVVSTWEAGAQRWGRRRTRASLRVWGAARCPTAHTATVGRGSWARHNDGVVLRGSSNWSLRCAVVAKRLPAAYERAAGSETVRSEGRNCICRFDSTQWAAAVSSRSSSRRCGTRASHARARPRTSRNATKNLQRQARIAPPSSRRSGRTLTSLTCGRRTRSSRS